MAEKGTVFVGLSGGVDSSVSALRLLRAGYRVVGVFIKTWVPDFLDCNIEAERLDAMRVAAKLEIPFLTFDATEEYRRDVAEYMIGEYQKGRTPNPDVMCNRYVKFGAFLQFALKSGTDAIATGHYAQVREESGTYRLYRGSDSEKDQSYFLWTLTQQELRSTLFPVGDAPKTEIRKEAKRYGLSTAEKRDSQGICFLGQVNMEEFLSHYVTAEPGNVLDESGRVVGRHEGALFYTLGQRHGFTITEHTEANAPRYVLSKDLDRNTVTVGAEPAPARGKRIVLSDTNVIADQIPETCEAQFRYRQKPFPVTVERREDGRGMLITVHDDTVELPAVGQSCVLYCGPECIGGGIINEILTP